MLCTAMHALKKGVATLASIYMGSASPPLLIRDAPHSLQKRDIHYDRNGKKLMFLGKAHRRIFKYCRQYGDNVHRSWAHAGLAPTLFACQRILGGWFEVEMEYLEGWSPAFGLLETSDNVDAEALLKSAIWEAYGKAAAIKIEDCPLAHGDMRLANIMVKTNEARGLDVKFMDFDWAGKVGIAKYPFFMNPEYYCSLYCSHRPPTLFTLQVHVILVVRKLEAAEAVKENICEEKSDAKIDILHLDLSSLASLRQFASDFKAMNLPLNILMYVCICSFSNNVDE
ncbi:hypothetical protein L7F22_052229 [Adiantum nelumboides]|nr:hypothetical protein [Adiantum nelumboides]